MTTLQDAEDDTALLMTRVLGGCLQVVGFQLAARSPAVADWAAAHGGGLP
jgi:hypothetical protein